MIPVLGLLIRKKILGDHQRSVMRNNGRWLLKLRILGLSLRRGSFYKGDGCKDVCGMIYLCGIPICIGDAVLLLMKNSG
jgi:hypothetical protein